MCKAKRQSTHTYIHTHTHTKREMFEKQSSQYFIKMKLMKKIYFRLEPKHCSFFFSLNLESLRLVVWILHMEQIEMNFSLGWEGEVMVVFSGGEGEIINEEAQNNGAKWINRRVLLLKEKVYWKELFDKKNWRETVIFKMNRFLFNKNKNIHTYVYIYIYTYDIHPYIYVCVCVGICVYTHTHTHTHTHIYIYIYIYI